MVLSCWRCNGLSYQDPFVRRVVDQVKDLGLYEKTGLRGRSATTVRASASEVIVELGIVDEVLPLDGVRQPLVVVGRHGQVAEQERSARLRSIHSRLGSSMMSSS
jgi:hypothetical protein